MPNLLVVYATGFFSLSLFQMTALATPLWGNHLGLPIFLIGVSAACRSVVPLIYSIHLGNMIDRFGAKRMGIIFSALCAACLLLHPLLRFDIGFMALQLLMGLATSTCWLVSLTAIARASKGQSSKAAWYAFSTSVGNTIGPLIFGFVWTHLSPTGGYLFLSLWALCLVVSFALLVRRADVVRPRMRAVDLVPTTEAYKSGWKVLRHAIVVFVIVCAFIRLGGITMFEAFYPLLLHSLGFTAATVGVLFAISNVVSSPASLLTPSFVRLCGSEQRALSVSIALLVVAITITPLVTTFWPLAFLMTIYGLGTGLSMPLVLTLLARHVNAEEQGLVGGLRATANRLASFALPVVMGLVAQLFSVTTAFWIVGAILVLSLIISDWLLYARHAGRRT